MGSIKTINNYDVFVKHNQCEQSINIIYKKLKKENSSNPIYRLTLGDWEFMQLNLMNLLIFHKKDKKLSFLTCMLMVQLTEIP